MADTCRPTSCILSRSEHISVINITVLVLAGGTKVFTRQRSLVDELWEMFGVIQKDGATLLVGARLREKQE